MKDTSGRFKGTYLRKKTWWLRFSLAGKQHRINLQTHDEEEAIKAAREILKNGPKEKKVSGKVWEAVIRKYVADKLADGSFRSGTVSRVKSALMVFAQRAAAPSPDVVTKAQLKAYYDTRRKKSEAGARSTMAMIQAFLAYTGNLPERLKYDKRSKINSRQVVVDLETANGWIDAAKRDDLRFVLFCGFHAGMRVGEMRFSRVPWFDLQRGVISIPAAESQVLPNSKRHHWQTKDSDPREIPISEEFQAFLVGFLASKKGHILKAPRRSGDGLWDFGTCWATFTKRMGRPEVFPHAMRHSWISELANSGNHTMQEIAAWSGDSLETIEKNYWKKRTEKGALNATLRGIRQGDEERNFRAEMMRLMAEVQAGQLAPSEAVDTLTNFYPSFEKGLIAAGLVKGPDGKYVDQNAPEAPTPKPKRPATVAAKNSISLPHGATKSRKRQ